MPANTAGTIDVPLEVFGGTVSDLAPGDLPQGASPDSQDVAFQVGLVKTRPGLQNAGYATIAGNPTINYLKTFITQQQALRMLTLDSLGNVYKENPIGTLTGIGTVVPGVYGNSVTQFAREWLAFGDGKYGLDIPRQYDDTNFDRVSQVGPGQAPGASDEVLAFPIVAGTGAQMSSPNIIVAAPNGATEAGFVCTIDCGQLPSGVVVGDLVKIAGVAVSGYNGQFNISAITSATTFQYVNTVSGLAASGGGTADFGYAQINTTTPTNFTKGQLITISGVGVGGYNVTASVRFLSSPILFFIKLNVFGLATSGSGNASPAGNIPAGVHGVSVVFKTRQGYITAPAPPVSWTASGGRRVVVSNIPIGPSNVVARIIIFTLAGGQAYYYLTGISQVFSSNFVINDNTTTTVTLDFTDGILAAGTSADYLFKLVELGECSGVIDYASRNFWWGERNKVQNAINLTFDGGFSLTTLGILPLGWTADPTLFTGGGQASVLGMPIVWGDAYTIIGNGVSAVRGQMTQPVFQDVNGVAILQSNTAYSVRARIARNAALVAGTLHIHAFSAGGGINTTGLQVTAAQASLTYTEFIATFLFPTATIPSDLVIRVFADGTPTGTGVFVVDCIEIFPTLQPFNTSLVRASRVEDPESFDSINGFMQYGESDGTRVTNAFKLRDSLYFAKERSLWQTKDDGVNEPAKWAINQISTIIGTPSNDGVGVGSDWVVVASRLGLYYFDGGEPEKISQEIQKAVVQADGTTSPGWDQINWQFGHTLWCQVDESNRRIMVGVPTGNATTPNTVFVMDYRGLDSGKDITQHKSIHISAYTGKIYDIADSRKWTRWNMTTNSCAQIERPDGTAHVFMGNGAGTGKIYDLLDVENFANPAQFGDDGVAINSYYDTYFFLRPQEEEQFQMGSHRKLYYYLTGYVEGQGIPTLLAFPPGNAPGIALPQSGNPLIPLVSPLFSIGISTVSRFFNTVTVTTVAPHKLTATSVAVIRGVTDTSYNGVFGNITIINTTSFKFSQVGATSSSTGGKVSPLTRDFEIPVNLLTERCKFRIGTNAIGSWFSIRTLTPSIRTDPFSPVRGVN